jgi:3-deoxy-7-phosphoheptulonate synthase
MIVVMRRGASRKEIEDVQKEIEAMGYATHPIYGTERTVIGAIGDERGKARLQVLETSAGVERVIPILKPYKLAGLELRKERTQIAVGRRVVFGGRKVPVIAGPCSVESLEQVLATARAVKKAGAAVLRGGAYKPRTSPYSFQGLQEKGLDLLDRARAKTGLPVCTEVTKESVLHLVYKHADIIQIGARNMQNYDLLKAVGKLDSPVVLKRGMASTISEWLMAAEYIMAQGNMRVILCERGIRTFETATRNTLDLSAVPVLKRETHLPVIVDPSHGTGHVDLVGDMALAAVAAGADGIMLEVHPNPHEAWSDGGQSLTPDRFAALMDRMRKVAQAVGREI